MAYELKLPDLGEGLTEGEVARWLVAEGQEVAEDEHAYRACPSSRERSVARSTASISVRRRPPASSVWMPAIAVPPGEVTMSLSWPGWVPVSSKSRAARPPP